MSEELAVPAPDQGAESLAIAEPRGSDKIGIENALPVSCHRNLPNRASMQSKVRRKLNPVQSAADSF